MSGVFYFPRYSQRENFATNNTLHLLYRLYEWNRRRFQKFMSLLLSEKADGTTLEIGLKLTQQVGTGRSVLDGFLHQPAVRIAIETKRSGAEFEVRQLTDHLNAFEAGSSGYLLLLRPQPVDLRQQQWAELIETAIQRNVLIASATFEELIGGFRECLMDHDQEMHELIDDFEAFCSEEDLLNSDHVTMFVPPCGQSFSINEHFNLYFCPSQWSRRNVRYLGIYKNRSVRHVGIIESVMRAEVDPKGKFTSQDLDGREIELPVDKRSRILGAINQSRAENDWDIAHGHKFFLCDQLAPTDFRKSTSRGIQGHRYLLLTNYLREIPPLEQLAQGLKEHTWE